MFSAILISDINGVREIGRSFDREACVTMARKYQMAVGLDTATESIVCHFEDDENLHAGAFFGIEADGSEYIIIGGEWRPL